MKKFLLYAALIFVFGAAWRSMMIDKREAEVRSACEQAMPGRDGQVASGAPDAAASQLIQINEEQQTCRLRVVEE